MEMWALLDNLYDGLDVQAGGLYHMGDSQAIQISGEVSLWLKGFQLPSENRGKMFCSVLGLAE